MGVLSNLEPKAVFENFEKICSIPHGSFDTKRLSDYLKSFAEERGLEVYQDDLNNIIMIKEATAGYENSEPVIIQGHMDMVCQKEDDSDFDFSTDGLKLLIDGDFVKADGTTLGADNGIAVAMGLAIMDSNELKHPRVELVITTEEEVGMQGADGIDVSKLRAKKFINVDSEEEGIFTVSCAGGVSVTSNIPVEREKVAGSLLKIELSGLKGGHSGIMIGEERASASKELARVLYGLSKEVDIRLVEFAGGLKDNAICSLARATVMLKGDDIEKAKAIVDDFSKILAHEYKVTDPNLKLASEKAGEGTSALTKESTKRVIGFLVNSPQGVCNMSKEIDNLVETSLNIGVSLLEENCFKGTYACRSSVESRVDRLIGQLECLTETFGGTISLAGRYPGWQYRSDSPLRDTCIKIFKEIYGNEPKIEAIHAGLECGLFAGKIGPELDCVSFGPDITGAHTPEERLSIPSTKRTWELLIKVLEACK